MSRVAIICAGGAFPSAIANVANNPFLILLAEAEKRLEQFEHIRCSIGQIGKMIKAAKNAGCNQICFVGSLIRPSLYSIIPDFYTFKLLPKALSAYKGGDNHILKSFAKVFENEGLKLVGAHEIAPQLLALSGVWTKKIPDETDLADISLAHNALKAVSEFDIGQGLVISSRHIIALEGAEGTDGLLERVALMRTNKRVSWYGQRGILVKALKIDQDHRLDMPSIGIKTVQNSHLAGLKGIAIEASAALVLDAQTMIEEANKRGLFIYGFEGNP